MSRPLPWHDTPTCREPGCDGPVVIETELGINPCCGACGTRYVAITPAETAKIARAEAAWELVCEGLVHEDRACAGCGEVLPIERDRLCSSCVDAENARRQGSLFPDLTQGAP